MFKSIGSTAQGGGKAAEQIMDLAKKLVVEKGLTLSKAKTKIYESHPELLAKMRKGE